MKLTTCGNCGNVYEDMNPGEESIDYAEDVARVFPIQELPTIQRIHEDGSKDGTGYYGCPECKTDGYLQDNVNPNCGGMAEEIDAYLNRVNITNKPNQKQNGEV